jgi:hypothetical protein
MFKIGTNKGLSGSKIPKGVNFVSKIKKTNLSITNIKKFDVF